MGGFSTGAAQRLLAGVGGAGRRQVEHDPAGRDVVEAAGRRVGLGVRAAVAAGVAAGLARRLVHDLRRPVGALARAADAVNVRDFTYIRP